MAPQEEQTDLAELFDLLEAGERVESPSIRAARPRPSQATTILPGPPMLREHLAHEIQDDLRTHGVVAGNRAVEVLRAVSAMLTDTDAGRHSGECLIAAIARRTGLRVRIENATVFTQVLGIGERNGG